MLLDSKQDFDEAIKEIDLLIDYAKRNQKHLIRYATFNKAAIVLLCAKFEAFLESFLEEYAYEHLDSKTNKSVHPDFHDHLIDQVLLALETTKNNKAKRKTHIKDLVNLCGDSEVSIKDYKFNTKFSYGKHGQTEVIKLLSGYGFIQYLSEDHVKLFFNKFNSLNNIRNNIVHQDATPALTHHSVKDYLIVTCDFIDSLQKHALTLL